MHLFSLDRHSLKLAVIGFAIFTASYSLFPFFLYLSDGTVDIRVRSSYSLATLLNGSASDEGRYLIQLRATSVCQYNTLFMNATIDNYRGWHPLGCNSTGWLDLRNLSATHNLTHDALDTIPETVQLVQVVHVTIIVSLVLVILAIVVPLSCIVLLPEKHDNVTVTLQLVLETCFIICYLVAIITKFIFYTKVGKTSFTPYGHDMTDYWLIWALGFTSFVFYLSTTYGDYIVRNKIIRWKLRKTKMKAELHPTVALYGP
jgi:hypothetical protein